MTDKCTDCIYNRQMTAWGETFEACHFKVDNPGAELYGADDCSGFEPKEKQVEMEFEKGASQ